MFSCIEWMVRDAACFRKGYRRKLTCPANHSGVSVTIRLGTRPRLGKQKVRLKDADNESSYKGVAHQIAFHVRAVSPIKTPFLLHVNKYFSDSTANSTLFRRQFLMSIHSFSKKKTPTS